MPSRMRLIYLDRILCLPLDMPPSHPSLPATVHSISKSIARLFSSCGNEIMESLNKLNEVYGREAKLTLENAFPMIRIHAIHAVFAYSKENFTAAFERLAEIEARRSTIKGLGRGEFGPVIPCHINMFIKQKRKEKRFEITCEKLCAERDAVALDTTQYDRKLLLAIEDVNALVADTKRDYRDAPQVHSVDHVICNKHSINFFSALLQTQEEYVQSGNPGYIDIGYHYTNSENIPSIIRSGLLSKDDRTLEKVVASRNNGAVFGNGVYTGDNPFTFSVYGNTCLLVARLQGSAVRAPIFLSDDKIDANTIIGDKFSHPVRFNDDGWPISGNQHETVLRSSSQCLALVRFSKSLLDSTKGKESVQSLQNSQQNIFNIHFNKEMERVTAGRHPLINPISTRKCWRQSIRYHSLTYTAPSSLESSILDTSIVEPPLTCNLNEEICTICLDVLQSDRPCAALNVCKHPHVFHLDCIREAMKSEPKCPVCRLNVNEPQGKSPSGTMHVLHDLRKCSGHDVNTIVITYDIPSASQLSYHESPGKMHGSKFVSAYLPNTIDGQNLLKRLKYAWLHGLIFTVGTSLTSGAHSQCVWASVHHKTCMAGGLKKHGYPDPGYFVNCNQELNSLGVPATEVINDDGIVMKPPTLQVKTAPTSDQPIQLVQPAGKNQQLAPILNLSHFQVKAPASIGQSTHLVNPVNTYGIVLKPSTLQVKAAASSDHGSNQQLNLILKPSSFQVKAPASIGQSAHLVNPAECRYEKSPSVNNGNNQQPRNDALQFEKDQRYALRWICINAD